MDIDNLAHDVQEAAANTKFEKYLLSDEPVRNREEREDVLLQRRLDDDTKKSREAAVKNQNQLQVEYNRINRNIDLQFATLLAQTHSGLKVPRPQVDGLHGLGGNGGRPLVGPQIVPSAVLGENAAGGTISHGKSGHLGGDLRSPRQMAKNTTEKSRNTTREEPSRADVRSTGASYFSVSPQQTFSTSTGRALPGPPPPSHRSGPSVVPSQSVSNYAIAFPVPFEESGFTSVIRWADIAYEEAVVAALGPGADFITLRQKELPSRVLVTVTCYVLNEILSRDPNLRDVWHKLRTPLFDAVYSPQMVGVQMVKRRETALKLKKSGADGKSIRKLFLQREQDLEEEKRGKCGYLESIPPSSIASGLNASSATIEGRNGVSYPYDREYREPFADDRERKKKEEEEEYGVVPSFPARYVQYTTPHDYASYCLWTEEMLQVKRLNNALAQRVTELKEVVLKSRLVLDLAGRRVDRYRKQFIFCAWRSYVASMGRCRRTATNYIIRQKNNRLLESCFLKWRRVPLQEKVDHLEAQVAELKRRLLMSDEIHQSEMTALRAKGKVAQDKLQDLTLKDEALRNQMLESHRLETTGLQSALTKSTKKAIQLREHSRRWERLAKTSRPMLLCRGVPKPLLSTAIDLCALEEEIFSNPISGWVSLAEAHPSLTRQAVPLLEQLLCQWVNFIMQGSPSHKSWVSVVVFAKKLNASFPPALLRVTNGSEDGRGAGSARGHSAFSSRPHTVYGEGEGGKRVSTSLGSRMNTRSRSSFSYPTMNRISSSSPENKSALCAALLGPLPTAAEPGQLSPHGLLMVIRELRRLLPTEAMDLERELGQANAVASAGGGSTTPFSRTMANYVGSLETKSNRKSFTSHLILGGAGHDAFSSEGGDPHRHQSNDLAGTEVENDGPHHSLDHSLPTTVSSSRAHSALSSPHSSSPTGSVKKAYLPNRFRRSNSRRRHPRQVVALAPPSPFALYQELTELLHAYSAEGLVPSLLQQCPYLDAFYTPQGLGYLSHPYFYMWVLAALFTGYVQKMVLMESAASTSSATPSGVRHYLRHSKMEQQIAKKAHPVVSATISAEVVNIPPALVEELQSASAAATSGGGPTTRRRSTSTPHKRHPSLHPPSASGRDDESSGGNVLSPAGTGGAYVIAKHTTVGKGPPPISASVLESEQSRLAAEAPGVAAAPRASSLTDSLTAGMSSSSPPPLVFTSSSLTCNPAYGSGAGIAIGRAGDHRMAMTTPTTSLPIPNDAPENGNVFTGPFRVTHFSEVPTVREGIDAASDMSVYLGCREEDLPDSDDDQYDVQEVVMEMVKEEEHLFALQREIRRQSMEDFPQLTDSVPLDGSISVNEKQAEAEEEGKERMTGGASGTGGTERWNGKGQRAGNLSPRSLSGGFGGRNGGKTDEGNASLTLHSNSKSKQGKESRSTMSSDLRSGKEKKKAKSHAQSHTSVLGGSTQRSDASVLPRGGRAGSAPTTIREIGGAVAWFPRVSFSRMGVEGWVESPSLAEEHKDEAEASLRETMGEGGFYRTPNDLSGRTSLSQSPRHKKKNIQKPHRFKSVAFEDGITNGTGRGVVGGEDHDASSTTMMAPPDVPSIPPFFWENDDLTREDIPEVRKVRQALENQITREKKRDRQQSAAFLLEPKEDLLSVEQVQFLHLLPRPSKAFNVVLHRDQVMQLKRRATERRSFVPSALRPRRSRPSVLHHSTSIEEEGGKEEARTQGSRTPLQDRRGGHKGPAPPLPSSLATVLPTKARSGALTGKAEERVAKGKGKTTTTRKRGNATRLEHSAIALGGGAKHARRPGSAREPQKGGSGSEGRHHRAAEEGETGSIGGGGEGEEESEEDVDEGVAEEAHEWDVIPTSLRRHLERLSVHTFAKRLVRDQLHRQEWLGVARVVTSFLVRIRVLDVGPGVPHEGPTASRLRGTHGSGRGHGGGRVGVDRLGMEGTMGSFYARYGRRSIRHDSPSSQDGGSGPPHSPSSGAAALSVLLYPHSSDGTGFGDSRVDTVSLGSGGSSESGTYERGKGSDGTVPKGLSSFVQSVMGEGGGLLKSRDGEGKGGSFRVLPSAKTPLAGEGGGGEKGDGASRAPRPSPSPLPPSLVSPKAILGATPRGHAKEDTSDAGAHQEHRSPPDTSGVFATPLLPPAPLSPTEQDVPLAAAGGTSSPLARQTPSRQTLPLPSLVGAGNASPVGSPPEIATPHGNVPSPQAMPTQDLGEERMHDMLDTAPHDDARREREPPAERYAPAVPPSILASVLVGGHGAGVPTRASGPSSTVWSERRSTIDDPSMVFSPHESHTKGEGLTEVESHEREKPSSSPPFSSLRSSVHFAPSLRLKGDSSASTSRRRKEKEEKSSRSSLSPPSGRDRGGGVEGSFLSSDTETRQSSSRIVEKERNTRLGHAVITPPPTATVLVPRDTNSPLETLRVSSGGRIRTPRPLQQHGGRGASQEPLGTGVVRGTPPHSTPERTLAFFSSFMNPMIHGTVDRHGSGELKMVKGQRMRHLGQEQMQETATVPLPSSSAFTPQSLNPLRVPHSGQKMGRAGAPFASPSGRRRHPQPPGFNPLCINGTEGTSRGIITNTSCSPDLTRMAVSNGRKITPAQHALDSVVIHPPAQVPHHSSSLPKDRFDIRKD